MSSHHNANLIIEEQLHVHARAFEAHANADVLTVISPIMFGLDDQVRTCLEACEQRKSKLAVVLETNGGYIQTAERIANTIRHHYADVEYYIPNLAMSAGTVLVMSGDAIHMDYYSILGPIDPQVRGADGRMVPALGYLIQYERLLEKSRLGTLTTVEAAILLQKFDQADLYFYEQARELSVTLLRQWLAKYKFKNWIITADRGVVVDDTMRQARAEEIARELNNTQRWHSHSRGISMRVLREELKLQIEDMGDSPELSNTLRTYSRLMADYMMRRGHSGALHTPTGYTPFLEE